jgi:hypothetical protein
MSAIRAAASKHTRTLSQPLRRSFYSPFAALQHSPLLAKNPTPTSSSSNNAAASSNASAAAHEHEREHAARTLHVVSEPNAADFKYGVPAGAYPNAAPYHQHNNMAQATLENVSPSSTSSAGAHPVLTRAALRDAAGVVGATRDASGEGGLGSDGERSKDAEEDGLPRLASRNPPPVQAYGEETGRLGLEEAWKRRK